MPSRPEISVVVPVRDGARTIPPLLQSLAAQRVGRERYEIVVVDNASSDGTAAIAAELGARVVHEPVPNRSRARNAGARAARADHLAFTDADCTVSPQWLETLLACRGRAPLVAGPVHITTGTPPNVVERFEALWRFSQEAWVAQGWAATANLLVQRRAWEAIGGFDPAYRHIGEDVDFCLRAARSGFPLGYCSGAVAWHGAEDSLSPLLRRAFFHGYSSAQVLARTQVGHVAWRDPRPLISPRAALERLGIAPGSLSRPDRLALGSLAVAAYASRVAGSIWAGLQRAG